MDSRYCSQCCPRLRRALLGALVCAGVFGVLALLFVLGHGFPYYDIAFAAAAGVGAALGGVVGPLLRWSLLRDVQLQRVIASVASGAVLWGVVGFVGAGFNPVAAVGTATMGAVVHAIRLRARTRPV